MTEGKIMTIVCSQGNFSKVFAALVLATTAKAMDVDVYVYFTFDGIDILKKDVYDNLFEDDPKANAMKEKGAPDIKDLFNIAVETGIHLVPCQLPMDIKGIEKEDIVDFVEEPTGASGFLDKSLDADLSYFL